MTEAVELPDSLWRASAEEPAPLTPPLEGDTKADVAVIGGGFTGLSAALHLAERGTRVVLLEAVEIGFGASGRNGGQVIPGLKLDPEDLVATYGPELGERMIEIAGGTADFVFDLVRRHGIRCDARQSGWMSAAHTDEALKLTHERARQWAARGADVAPLNAREIAELLGTDRGGYKGGWVDRRAGSVQPLAYARGLARAAMAAGAVLHGRSPVTGLVREGGVWRAVTAKGSVRADRVIIGTNGYTDDLLPGLKRTVIPVRSYIVATAPLSDNLRKTILPQGHCVSDSRQLLFYWRLDAHGRLVMGGRGPLRDRSRFSDYEPVRRAIRRLYPQVGEPQWQYHWNGRVAVTADGLPHLHEPAPGLAVALGYNGRGVAMASRMGKLLADHALGASAAELGFPVSPIRPIPGHAVRLPGLAAVIAWRRFQDWRTGGL
jgi:glycine/D-amino acid oxidase-like deaminating enzyme